MEIQTIAASAATAVSAGVIGLFWYDIKAFKRDTQASVNDLREKIQHVDCLSREEHGILCENRGLRITGRIDLLEQGHVARFDTMINKIDALHARLDDYAK